MPKGSAYLSLRRLVSLLPKKSLLGYALASTVIISVLTVYEAHVLRGLMDAVVAADMRQFGRWLWIVLGVTAIQVLLLFFRQRVSGQYTEQGIAMLREQSMAALTAAPLRDFEKQHSGDYISRLTVDINRVQEFCKTTLPNVIFQPLTAAMATVYLLVLNWKLTLITLFGVPAIFIVGSILSAPLQRFSKVYQEKLAKVNASTQDTIAGIEIARAFGLEEQLKQRFDSYANEAKLSGLALSLRQILMAGLSDLLGVTPFLICFGFGGWWVIRGELSTGSLVAYIQLLNHLTFPIGQLPQLMGRVKSDMAAADRVLELIDIVPEASEGERPSIEEIKSVVFDSVVFQYRENNPVLRGVSFTVNQGETVAIVGASGCGKTTALKLIARLYSADAGQILVNGLAVDEWSLHALRNAIAVVSQDNYLFAGSIRENIAYGRPDASDDSIVEAACAANAHDFIQSLPEGYDSLVGELGGKLSGGQKQRIALARAILKNAPLLLLDEATSALDTQSEALVQDALEKLMQGRTAIVVAHRLSTIQKADRIVVLSEGSVVAIGTHSELLASRGIYADLYERQLREAI